MPIAPGPYTVFLCAKVWCISANPAVGPARVKLAVADLKSVCTTDDEWDDTYRMVVAAGSKPGGAQALLALAGKAGVPGLPKKTPSLKASAVVTAIKSAADIFHAELFDKDLLELVDGDAAIAVLVE